MDGTAVTGVCWIPRGKAKPTPETVSIGLEDVKELLKEMHQMKKSHSITDYDTAEINEASGAKKVSPSSSGAINSSTDESGDEDDECIDLARGEFPGSQFFSSIQADLPYIVNDPFLQQDSKKDEDEEDEDEANYIRPTDCPLIAVTTDQELPTLEVYIYDYATGAFYIHHDINIGAPPLCVEWLEKIAPTYSTSADGSGNYAAVGAYGHSMIEIWDLDVMDEMEPVMILGHLPESQSRRTNKVNKQGINGHTAPVLALARNPHRVTVLASGSADQNIKIWDLVAPACVETLKHHTDKVQTLKWHPVEESILLTASYDKTFSVVDVRTPSNVLKGSLHSDAEACCWDRNNPAHCWLTAENGNVFVYDIRTISTNADKSDPLYSMHAHTDACTGVSDCGVPGLMVTCSLSGHAKVWNANDVKSGQPASIFERDLKAGPLFSMRNNPDENTVFSFGGSVVVVWDVADSNEINLAFNMPLVEPLGTSASVETGKVFKYKSKRV